MDVRPRQASQGPWFKADAKAEGQSKANAPWAFSRGEHFRSFAAIELFASLVSLMVFTKNEKGGERGLLHQTGLTDNSGNTSALSRLMSSKFPLVVIMTEMAAQLQAKEAELDLHWIPRNQNEKADGLTNDEYGPFDQTRRIHVEVSQLSFLVLLEMVRVADDLYERVKKIRAETRVVGRNTTMGPEASKTVERARALDQKKKKLLSDGLRQRRGSGGGVVNGRLRKGSLVAGTVRLGQALEGEPLNKRHKRESLATSAAVLHKSWHQRGGLAEVGSGGGARREEMKAA